MVSPDLRNHNAVATYVDITSSALYISLADLSRLTLETNPTNKCV